MTNVNGRIAEYPVDPQFLNRWSTRAYDSAPVSKEDLFTLFEAARWAPSSYNSQPWRFLYAHRDTPEWSKFLGLLNEFNQSWAQHSSVLVVLVSSKLMVPPGGSAVATRSHSLDAGAAWGYFALEAARLGLHAHAMVGFDIEAAQRELGVPEDFHVEAVISLGRRGDPAALGEKMAARDVPNGRRPVAEIAAEGDFANLGAGTSI